jgi:hypothetical protein
MYPALLFRNHFSPLQHCFGGQFLHIRRIAKLPQGTFYYNLQFRIYAFLDGTVDRGVFPVFNLLILHFIEMEKIQLFKNACRCQHGYLYDPRQPPDLNISCNCSAVPDFRCANSSAVNSSAFNSSCDFVPAILRF